MARYLSGKQIAESAFASYSAQQLDLKDPSPWLALFLDRSLPMMAEAKAAYLKNCESWSRQFLLALIRPFCRLAIIVFKVLKVFLPGFSFSKPLHYLIYIGQKYFVSPEANFIIMRHFFLGSQILKFIVSNVPGFRPTLASMAPVNLKQIYTEEIYLNHDINLYNFIISLNQFLKEQKTNLQAPAKVDYSAIEPGDFGIEKLRDGWTNFLDAESAIEIFTPVYQLFLSDRDFWRAFHSLQFDETIAIYVATLIGNTSHIGLVNNKHPLSPVSGLYAAPRLVLHGIASELLHGLLAASKRASEGSSLEPLIFKAVKS